jgi:hypothetical protein
VGAVTKQFVERAQTLSKARILIEDYARKRVQEVMPMPTLVERNVAKAADTQRALREAIAEYQASHPNANRADVIDKILFSRPVSDLHQAERRETALQKLGGGNLPTPPPGTMHRTHNDSAPVHGRTGYNSADDDRPPHNPDAGENPIIRDHHETLRDIASGKLNWADPKVSALVALERKRVFENE